MNAEYPLSHDNFERAVLIGPVFKQPMTPWFQNERFPTLMMKEVFTLGSRRYQSYGNFGFLCFFFSNSYRIFGRPWASPDPPSVWLVFFIFDVRLTNVWIHDVPFFYFFDRCSSLTRFQRKLQHSKQQCYLPSTKTITKFSNSIKKLT